MSQFESFNDSAVLITDISNVSKSFSAVTERPSIFFRPWMKTYDLEPQNFMLACNTYENLGKKIRNIRNNPEAASVRVKNLLGGHIPPMPVRLTGWCIIRLLLAKAKRAPKIFA